MTGKNEQTSFDIAFTRGVVLLILKIGSIALEQAL